MDRSWTSAPLMIDDGPQLDLSPRPLFKLFGHLDFQLGPTAVLRSISLSSFRFPRLLAFLVLGSCLTLSMVARPVYFYRIHIYNTDACVTPLNLDFRCAAHACDGDAGV